jgi:2-amino-4-hydroxy-6-hydroxymethyldihydropteridine diphosphokinase
MGSNLGRKGENLARARRLLEQNGVRILRKSGEYRTQPVGNQDQPWFINQVVEAETGLEPLELLALIKRLESEMKRRPGPRGSPRRIDIDVLLAGRCMIFTPLLQVPHPRLAQRNFVLRPLAEIAPRAIHPVLRKTVRRLLRETNDRSSAQKLRGRRGEN